MAVSVPNHVYSDILVFPHFDLHAVLTGAPKLKLDVQYRLLADISKKRYDLLPVIGNTDQFAFDIDFLAPHNPPGQRGANLPTVAANGEITVTTTGIYLFQIAVKSAAGGVLGSAVGRLQVHDHIVDWWFGNDSITTALDTTTGHARPSIYARFSDEPSGTDLVGDITGHGYVTLTSSDTTKVDIDARGRLRGLVETNLPVNVTGTFSTIVNPPLPVRVVNYAKARPDLHILRLRDAAHAEEKANVVFLAEGFRDQPEDKSLFDAAVTRASRDIFDKPRHEPYPLLVESFNVFRAATISQQQLITCGYRVTDNSAAVLGAGRPVPDENPIPHAVNGRFNLLQLVEMVGLPMRGEIRAPAVLTKFWMDQRLPDFQQAGVDDNLINAWKELQSAVFLQASDTLFGTYLGSRLADGSRVASGSTPPAPVSKDIANNAADQAALPGFIRRLYDFYKVLSQRELTLDPRRHPPELYATKNLSNLGNSVLSYLAGLQYFAAPNYPIGQNWIPDDTKLMRSRGLVVLTAYDDLLGGTAINDGTLAATTVSAVNRVTLAAPDPDHPKATSRARPPAPNAAKPNGIANLSRFTDTAAHELGHNFNLGDEYEETGGLADSFEATSGRDLDFDNLSLIGFLRTAPDPNRTINPDKIKWLNLPRMQTSSRLLHASITDLVTPSHFTVTVGPDQIDKWVKAWTDGTKISLINSTESPTKKQLPLPLASANVDFVTDLTIFQEPDRVGGSFVLVNPHPSVLPLTFRAGSVVFVPLRDSNGVPRLAVPQKVADFLRTDVRGHLPLNQNRDLKAPTQDVQVPIAIRGFVPPADAYRLVGIFEGGNHVSRGFYRPTGACKMRNQFDKDDKRGQFCFVCKWLIVNLVDASQHALLDQKYYPR